GADGTTGQTGKATKYLPLRGDRQAFETGVALAGATQNVVLQGAQQVFLASAAQEEVGAGAHMLFQLAPGWRGRSEGRSVTQAYMPQQQAGQQCQGGQGGGVVLEQLAEQASVFGVVDQGDGAVLGKVPEQP